ncbi:MAG: macro domain-containing protein [bacterium]|nr:macro domain-containing protein [bacterium]
MIEYRIGDLLATDAEALVNTVNCVGHMGRGVALQFKKAWPANFQAYAAACERQDVRPGQMFVFETGQLTNPRFIINFPTKRHWRGKSLLEDIDSGLVALVEEIGRRGIRSIALPPLGAGLGGLDWDDVRPRIEHALGALPDVQVILFEPHSTPDAGTSVRRGKVPPMTTGRAALIKLMAQYLGGLLDPYVSLLEVHKLMYFMQAAGEPLRLNFTKGYYGPYAENLRHVLNAIEGHYVVGYGAGGDDPDKPLELLPGAVDLATTCLAGQVASQARFDRAARLVDGFESPSAMELLATVHWILERESPADAQELVRAVHAWGEGKQRFQSVQIQVAARVLREQGWVAA